MTTPYVLGLIAIVVLGVLLTFLAHYVDTLAYRRSMEALSKQGEQCLQFHRHLYTILGARQSPNILVDTTVDGVDVPKEWIKDGKIVLDISPRAVKMDSASEGMLRFRATFNGAARQVCIPFRAIKGLFSKQTRQGINLNPAA